MHAPGEASISFMGADTLAQSVVLVAPWLRQPDNPAALDSVCKICFRGQQRRCGRGQQPALQQELPHEGLGFDVTCRKGAEDRERERAQTKSPEGPWFSSRRRR